MSKSFELALHKSGGRCEALVNLDLEEVWTRCFRSPVEIHHRLTRARGGDLLDELNETYHLMALCRFHHKDAHDTGIAIETGLLLEGQMYYEAGLYRYAGPDQYLMDNYGVGVRL